MALTYTQFLVLSRPGESFFAPTISVSAWAEDTEWSGELRPAFNGTMLSTLRTPKRRIQATFEFASGADLETFLAYIASSVDPGSRQITGLRRVSIFGVGPDSSLRNKVMGCYIQPGRMTPTQEVVNSAVILHWSVEMTILEA